MLGYKRQNLRLCIGVITGHSLVGYDQTFLVIAFKYIKLNGWDITFLEILEISLKDIQGVLKVMRWLNHRCGGYWEIHGPYLCMGITTISPPFFFHPSFSSLIFSLNIAFIWDKWRKFERMSEWRCNIIAPPFTTHPNLNPLLSYFISPFLLLKLFSFRINEGNSKGCPSEGTILMHHPSQRILI